jgi:HlyD family secretion protein
LLPGLSADVEVIVQKHDDVVRVPTSAILQGGRVLIVRDSTLVQVTVRTGLTNWEFSEIIDGLKAGDLIVVSLDRPEVRAGAHVRIESETGK